MALQKISLLIERDVEELLWFAFVKGIFKKQIVSVKFSSGHNRCVVLFFPFRNAVALCWYA